MTMPQGTAPSYRTLARGQFGSELGQADECQRCGALVVQQGRERHNRWHDQLVCSVELAEHDDVCPCAEPEMHIELVRLRKAQTSG